MKNILKERSNGSCELCKSLENLQVYVVPPKEGKEPDECAYICNTCIEQIENSEKIDSKHWFVLGDTMWSEVPAIQVLSYRILNVLKDENWSKPLLDILHLNEDTKAWADSTPLPYNHNSLIHRDCEGSRLQDGDSVTLIKDIDFKGANFIVRQGTVIRDIRLDKNDVESLEGKINDTRRMVTLTKFVKKN